MESIFYTSPPCLYSHVEALFGENADDYVTFLQGIAKKGILKNLPSSVLGRVIAALHITQHHPVLEDMLQHCEVVHIVNAVKILDQARQVAQLRNKIDNIEQKFPHVVDLRVDDEEAGAKRKRARKIDVLRKQLKKLLAQQIDQHGPHAACYRAHQNSAVLEMVGSASLSGSLSRKIRKWAKSTLTNDFLVFVVLSMPMDNWKKLADLVHFHPSDFALHYFLPYAYGAPLPENSFAARVKDLMAAPQNELLGKYFSLTSDFPQVYLCFKVLRLNSRILAEKRIAQDLVRGIPLDTAIWYLDELSQAGECYQIVCRRLTDEGWRYCTNSKVFNSYGKLLERILTFQKRGWNALARKLKEVAGVRITALKEQWQVEDNGLTVTFGDASYSMSTAIEAATILATMISVVWGGELSFFDNVVMPSPCLNPSTVDDTLEICRKINARGATSLAAALWPYFEQSRKVERIVMVTDEEENTSFNGFMFAKLLRKYMDQVYSGVRLTVVCVGSGCSSFQSSLDRHNIGYKRLVIDERQPDLSKFDALLGSLDASTRQGTSNVSNEDDFILV